MVFIIVVIIILKDPTSLVSISLYFWVPTLFCFLHGFPTHFSALHVDWVPLLCPCGWEKYQLVLFSRNPTVNNHDHILLSPKKSQTLLQKFLKFRLLIHDNASPNNVWCLYFHRKLHHIWCGIVPHSTVQKCKIWHDWIYL